MTTDVFQGSLFSSDFLTERITASAEWQGLTDADIAAFGDDLTAIFGRFPTAQTPNESQTEDDLGGIDIHRSQIIVAARWMKPVKWIVRRS